MRRSPRMFRAIGPAAMLALVCSSPAGAQTLAERDAAQTALRAEDYAKAAEGYGAIVRANPFDGASWGDLGFALHALKRYDEAIAAYERAIALGRRPETNYYNKACALALSGKTDEALESLGAALDHQFAQQQMLETDTDLDSLRGDKRFAELTGVIKGLATPVATGRDEGWRWDLDYYARRMKLMHWDLYAKVSEQEFLAAIEKLKGEVSSLDDQTVRLRLRRIAALVGDGHTTVQLGTPGAPPAQRIPLHLFAFAEGLHVMGAAKEHADLVGARVLKVGGLTVEEAVGAARAYIPVDNEMGYLAQTPTVLTMPTVLREIGAAPDTSGASYTLKMKDGSERTVHVSPVELPESRGLFAPGFVYAHEASAAPASLLVRHGPKVLSMEHLAAHKAVYFYFGAVQNPPGGSLPDFARSVLAKVEETASEHLIIDMRFNGGGNTGLVRDLILGIAGNQRINRRGHLWVIIGRHTFSAAQNTTNLFESLTRATFVGEPTGSRPHFVGESDGFVLPHSGTRVYCSTRYWQVLDSTDHRTWVNPHIAAPVSFADYAENRDPALEAILAEIGAGG